MSTNETTSTSTTDTTTTTSTTNIKKNEQQDKPFIPTCVFISLVYVKYHNRYLLVQEVNTRYFIPAGKLEIGESFAQGALRETLEESGVKVELKGILRIDHSPGFRGYPSRMLAYFLAEPIIDQTIEMIEIDNLEYPKPKASPDHHSLCAKWFTIDQIKQLSVEANLRSDSIPNVIAYIESNQPVYPLSMLALEGSKWTIPNSDGTESPPTKEKGFLRKLLR
ncbi:hypothetical protein DFA_05677 [Cavenderia fasciculata]|uniref:Nudix hydrolase domain-containing protein n=1 Tax=Cavenderia fasciculata TaxID=261658 RepID=F4PLZ0_CACFS|nr:uncharacterized protein DFA_05677 [Cavenderia fasciculata]EGG23544.1 hypothetical protein DFA_05677 [Cavenderia fasciculata]|eukprot:XP_004361395.1 hypothetical protein DFA_05677 [Cavenderia fasciculata]